MYKNFAETLREFEQLTKKEDKINFLRANITENTVKLLQGAYLENVEWIIESIPDYQKFKNPASNLEAEMRKLYLFEKNNPERPDMPYKKVEQLFIRTLESLEPNEAEVLVKIVTKQQLAKGLTRNLLAETFPGWF